MIRWKNSVSRLLAAALLAAMIPTGFPARADAAGTITHNASNKTVTIANAQMSMVVNYDHQTVISSMKLGGTTEVIDSAHPADSAVKMNPVQFSASHTYHLDSLASLNDGVISYTDSPRNRWTSYGSPNTQDWIVYDWGQNVTVSSAKLYFYDDNGGVKAPQSYTIQYWNGSAWANVSSASYSPASPAGNQLNTVTFSPVTTSKVRVLLNHKTGAKSGATEIAFLNGTLDVSTVEWKGTGQLAASPSVNVSGNTVTFSGIAYGGGGNLVSESWTFTANDDAILLQINRTMSQDATLSDQRMLGFAFKEKAFDVVQRTEDGGSFILLDHDRNTNRTLSNEPIPEHPTGGWYNNDQFSFYTTNVDLIDKLNGKMLSIELDTNRSKATRIWRDTNRSSSRALQIEHKVGVDEFTFPTGQYLPLSNYQTKNFSPVDVAQGQTDTVNYTFRAASNLNKYYDLGVIPTTSGLNEYWLAQMMQDYGRSSVIDLHVGVGDTDYSGMGPYELWWYTNNALGLEGAGNSAYIDTLKNFVRFIRDYNYPIHNNGRLYAVSARDASWYKDYFFDTYGQFAAGVANLYHLTGDADWLDEVKDVVRGSLDWVLARDSNGNGLVESFGYGITQWDDNTNIGEESSYANVFLYKGLLEWADIEQFVLGNNTRASTYRNRAALIRETMNKDTSNGGFWSPETKSFVHSKRLNGTVRGDVSYVFENAYAILFDLVDRERAVEMLNEYTKFMDANDLVLMPAQRANYTGGENTNPFPSYLNGNIFPQMAFDMMAAYAKIGDGKTALSMLKVLVDQYAEDGLVWNTYNWDMTPDRLREPWFSANARPASGFYSILLGIQPRYDKLIIDPTLDSSLYGVSVPYRVQGHAFTIGFTDAAVRTIQTDGAIPVESRWSHLPLNVKYAVKDENLSAGTTVYAYVDSGAAGKVSYTFSSAGVHRLTLLEDEVNLALNTAGSGNPAPTASYTYYGDNVYRAIDGLSVPDSAKPRTRWTPYGSGNGTDWYALDFGTAKNVAQVNLNFYHDSTGVLPPAGYTVQYWNGSSWQNVSVRYQYPAQPAAGENVVAFDPVSTQKIRVVLTHVTGKYSGINEMRVYGPSNVNLAFNPAAAGNPAPSASFTYGSDSVWNAVDGNIFNDGLVRTRWTPYNSGNTSDWYAVDLGSARGIREVRLNLFRDGLGILMPGSINMQYWNGSAWVNVPSQTVHAAASSGGEIRITFPAVTTSKIRVELQHQPGKYSGINEFRVYE